MNETSRGISSNIDDVEVQKLLHHIRFRRYANAFPDYVEMGFAAELYGPSCGYMSPSPALFKLVESWPSLYRANKWLRQFDEVLLEKRTKTVLAGREWTLEDSHWRDGEE